jgi:hypothetical protein
VRLGKVYSKIGAKTIYGAKLHDDAGFWWGYRSDTTKWWEKNSRIEVKK